MDHYKHTLETWNKVAKRYEEKFMDLDLYNDSYDSFCELAAPGANVLEIGCGPGNITRYIHSKRPDLHITATDASPEMIKLATENVPGIDAFVMDCRAIGDLSATYDAIMCGFVLPYLSKEDCGMFIADCGRKLLQGGILYLSFIEGNHSLSGYETSSSGDKMYIYYYDEAFIRLLLAQNNFKMFSVFCKADLAGQKELNTHNIIARKK